MRHVFSKIAGVAIILALGACGTIDSPQITQTQEGDRCKQGVKKDSHLAYKLCVWENTGPATNLAWDRNESRSEVRRDLYKAGTLYSGCVLVEVGLRNVNLSKGMTVIRSAPGGKTEAVSFSASSAKNADVVVDVCGGEGTLWVPNAMLGADHYVQLRSVKGPALAYNHPQMNYFTKNGEDMEAAGKPRHLATRLNTKMP